MTSQTVTIEELDGFCPTQGRGQVDGLRWCYRSRGGLWTLAVATSDCDLAEVGGSGASGWRWEGTDDFAGFVPVEIAERLIRDLLGSPRATWPTASRRRVPVRISEPWGWVHVFGDEAEAMLAPADPQPDPSDGEHGATQED